MPRVRRALISVSDKRGDVLNRVACGFTSAETGRANIHGIRAAVDCRQTGIQVFGRG